METNSSLNRSIDEAKKHYSSLFSLPSLKTALAGTAILSFMIALLSYVASPSLGLFAALALGLSLFALTLSSDLITSKVILSGDPIFNVRRTMVVSLVGLAVWLVFILVGVGLSFPFGWLLWVQLSLFGYGVALTLRIIVTMATSMSTALRRGTSVLLQPILCVIAFFVFWNSIRTGIELQVISLIIVIPVIAFIAVFVFFWSLEHYSKKFSSMASIPLFRAFIVNWVTSLNAPLEKYLENMGQDVDIEVSLLKFDSSKPKAAIIIPQVHPGPFKNIGSSLLPSLLKKGFEKEYGCETCTPLGILGHELDLASQAQNQKIISQTIASARFEATAELASPLVRASEGHATASCQIFGGTALLAFTLAPKTTEDLPQELGRFVREQAQGCGLKDALVINAHNSLSDIVDTDEHLDELKAAASKCLQKAVAQQAKHFMVGAASVFPQEFSSKAGMGEGGITATIVQVENQKIAYIVIDGNNMIPNLREKIISSLAAVGFEESEVFTTDTHAVSALVTGRRGYHPVGEVMDHELLIHYIIEAAKKAESNLADSTVGYLRFMVPQVRVIGEERLKSITTLVDKGIQRAKQLVIPVFGLEGLILLLLLIFLIR
jgi:putative membrane protein